MPLPAATALTLTTGEPLARALRSDYALTQRRQGGQVWEVPAIASLQRWCREQWLQTWPAELLLHGVQELVLWQRAIEADGAARDVLSKSALTREARATGRLVAQYLIDPGSSPVYTAEQAAFRRWHRRVRRELSKQGCVLDAELPGRVADLVTAGKIHPPQAITLRGPLHLLTPLERRLLQALEQRGCGMRTADPPPRQPRITASCHADGAQQFRALAVKIRDRLLPCLDSGEPPPNILVACPDPDTRRELIEAAFTPLLAPWRLLPGEGQRPLPWRFAAGRGLDRQPVIAVAQTVCALTERDNRLDELSRLLLASALWTPAQRELTARADYALRKGGGTRFSLKTLQQAMPEALCGRFGALRQIVRAQPRRALPSAWVEHFELRLEVLGWPGERALPSPIFQACENWRLGLATFSAMDAQIGPVAHGQAVAWLREIIGSRPFEPRVDHEQPVQILSLEEATGLPADDLFVVDATDNRLPGPVRRYPLLATDALARAGVPGITAADTLANARILAQALTAQAGSVHLSYAAMDERGAACRPTPLFAVPAGWPIADTPAGLDAVERSAREGQMVVPAADPVPPVRDPAAEGVFGGVNIFKAYVEAPFFAFCRFRLGIEALPEPAAGIPANVQGNIVHRALEQIWRELRTQQALKQAAPAALGALLDTALDQAMNRHMPRDRYGRWLRRVERGRLRDIVLQWLEHETRRVEPFEVVAREQRAAMRFEGLALQLVIDRVDRVATAQGERYLILDYKTGREAEVRGWRADRLQEPQLPLYATSAALDGLGIPRVDGIAFAHIKDGHPALAAATDWGMGLIDRKKTFTVESWPAQLAAWREALTIIARGFLAGEAGLGDPARYRFGLHRALLDLVRDTA